MEQTLVFVKPDGVQRRLVGKILQRFEEKGLVLQGIKIVQLSDAAARRHYAEHEGKPFFARLVRFVTSGPVVLMVIGGPHAIATARSLVGPTFGAEAAPGTIRGDFGLSIRYNLVHASDGQEAAAREISRFFQPEELVSWQPADIPWIDETLAPQE